MFEMDIGRENNITPSSGTTIAAPETTSYWLYASFLLINDHGEIPMEKSKFGSK